MFFGCISRGFKHNHNRPYQHWRQDGGWHALSIVTHATAWRRELSLYTSRCQGQPLQFRAKNPRSHVIIKCKDTYNSLYSGILSKVVLHWKAVDHHMLIVKANYISCICTILTSLSKILYASCCVTLRPYQCIKFSMLFVLCSCWSPPLSGWWTNVGFLWCSVRTTPSRRWRASWRIMRLDRASCRCCLVTQTRSLSDSKWTLVTWLGRGNWHNPSLNYCLLCWTMDKSKTCWFLCGFADYSWEVCLHT